MSNIEWTGKTWNPSVGCHKVSQGCKNCYAEKMHARLTAMGVVKYAEPFRVVKPWPDHLNIPLRRKKATTWFVNSMTDLFHEDLPDEYIAAVFGVMAACPQHTFQVLTKRPERALRWWELCVAGGGASVPMRWAMSAVHRGIDSMRVNGCDAGGKLLTWPLPNVWLGVSVEDQDTADLRIPLLLQYPAAVRFVSYEPALDRVDLGLDQATCDCCPRWASRWIRLKETVRSDWPLRQSGAMHALPGVYRATSNRHGALCVTSNTGADLGVKPAEFEVLGGLDWVIVGGESGPGARPFDVQWARSVVHQCREAGVACFVKQLGAHYVDAENGVGGVHAQPPADMGVRLSRRLKDKKGGDMSEWPEDLRVREMPA